MSAEAWTSELDGVVHGMSRSEMIDVRCVAFRAAAIAVMKNRQARWMTYDMHRDEVGRKDRNYRVGERFEAKLLHVPNYTIGANAVGMARDTIVPIPRRRNQSRESFVKREEFYIRNSQQYTSGKEPDISLDGWAIPRGDVRLPSLDVASKDIYCADIKNFGREISRLAAAEGVLPALDIDEMRATNLAEVPHR